MRRSTAFAEHLLGEITSGLYTLTLVEMFMYLIAIQTDGGISIIEDYNQYRHAKLIIIFITCLIIYPVYSQDCQILKFENFSDFSYFNGDFSPSNESMKILESTPERPAVVDTTAVSGASDGTLHFSWRIDGRNSNVFNLIFCVDGVPYKCLENPFYKKIPVSTNNSHELKWILQHNGKDHIGETKANAFIDDFMICGLSLDSNNINILPNNTSRKLQPDIMPSIGNLNDSYTINISKKDISCDPILEIKNPRIDTWENFGKGIETEENITFKVPDLSFLEPPFLGFIECRLINDESIYPFKGPNINLNFKNFKKDRDGRTISVDVLSAQCVKNICLSYNNTTIKRKYTGCNKWQTLTFGPIEFIDYVQSIDCGGCYE